MTQEGPTEFESFTPTVWRRLDYGFNGSVGFVYDIYTLNFNYEHGLYNIVDVANVNNIGIINKNRVYSVSLGFRF